MTLASVKSLNSSPVLSDEEEAPVLEVWSRKDLIEAANNLSEKEIRYIVDFYYTVQESRKRAGNQARDLAKGGEPNSFIGRMVREYHRLEKTIKKILEYWVQNKGGRLAEWCLSIVGIGPVITAGLINHIDVTKCACVVYREMKEPPPHDCPGLLTVGHIWRFAGLDPNCSWEKGQKRPWNASLKTLCWKIGESFVKFSNHPDDIYGKIYVQRKALEVERNENNAFAEQAAAQLKRKNFKKTTEAYKNYIIGKLPPAHIHARAKRYAVKIFLAHFHEVAFELQFGKKPPMPYVIEHLGHVDKLTVPNWP